MNTRCGFLPLLALSVTMPVISMMRGGAGGASASSGDVLVEVAAEAELACFHDRIVVPNKSGNLFEQFAAEVQDNLADEVKHRIGRLADTSKPEAHPFLSVDYFNHCVAQAAVIRAGTGSDEEKNFRLLQKSKDLIQNIMEWLPARDCSHWSTEKRLADFDLFLPPAFFEIAMSRDGVVVYIPNPYFLNQTGKTCLQKLHEARPSWDKRIFLRPGATEADPIDDAHAIWLFKYLD